MLFAILFFLGVDTMIPRASTLTRSLERVYLIIQGFCNKPGMYTPTKRLLIDTRNKCQEIIQMIDTKISKGPEPDELEINPGFDCNYTLQNVKPGGAKYGSKNVNINYKPKKS